MTSPQRVASAGLCYLQQATSALRLGVEIPRRPTKPLSGCTSQLWHQWLQPTNPKPQHARFSSSSSSSGSGKQPHQDPHLRSPLGSHDAVVENTGSVARDHLANERTFLAWAQVGLAFTAAGTALFTAYHQEREVTERLEGMTRSSSRRRKTHREQTICAASGLLWANGGLLLVYSLYRYLTVQRFLREGKFILAKRGLFGVTFATAICTSGALALVYSS